MDEGQVAVTGVQAPTAEPTANVQSASTNQTPVSNNATPEKAQITQGTETEGTPNHIPYDRFAEVVAEKNRVMQEAQEYRALVEGLRKDPNIARAFFQNMPEAQIQPDPVVAQAEQALAQLGYAKKSDVVQEVLGALKYEEAQKSFISSINELQTKYSGSDGLPKFEPEKVVKYMDETGISDPEKAYRDMNFDAIVDAKAKAVKSSAYSEKPGKPMQTAQTDDMEALRAQAKETGDVKPFLMQWIRNKGITFGGE